MWLLWTYIIIPLNELPGLARLNPTVWTGKFWTNFQYSLSQKFLYPLALCNDSWFPVLHTIFFYCTRAIITRNLYTFCQHFKVQKRFSIFLKILSLCMVSIHKRVIVARVQYMKGKGFFLLFQIQYELKMLILIFIRKTIA